MADSNKKNPDKKQQQTDRYLTDSQMVIRQDSPKFAKYTVLLLAVVILVAILWASFATIAVVVTANGRVVAADNLQIIQHLEGGMIKQIFVKDGQHVRKGQILLSLQNISHKAEYQRDLEKVYALRARVVRLRAVVSGESTLVFPPDLLKLRPNLVSLEKKLFEVEKTSLQEKLAILQEEYRLTQRELNMVMPLVRKNILSDIEGIRLKKTLNRVKGTIHSEKSKVLRKAQDDLSRAEIELNIMSKSIQASQDKLKRTIIRSPIDGIVNNVYVTTIGEVVNPGKTIVDIVPINKKLIIEAKVTPANIGFIRVGQKAKVKVTAYTFLTYGGLDAKVIHVSPDTILDSKGESFYEIKLQTNRNYLVANEKKLYIKPGMNVTADLISGKRTIMQYLFRPIINIRTEAGSGR